MTQSPKLQRKFTVDWLTALLVSLVVGMQVGGIATADHIASVSALGTEQITNASYGFKTAVIIVVESILLIFAYRFWGRLPEWVQKLVKYALGTGLLLFGAYLYAFVGQLGLYFIAIGGFLAYVALDKFFEALNLDWITFNTAVVGIGVMGLGVLGTVVGPTALLPLLALLIVWDHVAVNLTDLMAKLIEVSADIGIPNYLIIPSQLRVDYESVSEYVKDTDNTPRPDGVASIIGLGDFVIPGALTVSAWIAGQQLAAITALAGTAIAMVVLRDAMERRNGAVPALPWLNTGAIIGFAIGTVTVFVGATA